MKRIILASAAVLSLSGLAATTASADSIDRVQAQQQWEIRRGVASGQITRQEYRSLEAEQRHIAEMERRAKADGHVTASFRRIAEMERRAKADGHVTASERARIAEAQRNAGRHIYQESHDSQRSWFRRWW